MSERSLVADFVEELFVDNCTPEYVAAAEEDGYGAALWQQMSELGLTLPAVPESLGGQGATLVEQIEVLRLAGRFAAPLPLMETGLLAGWLLTRAGLAAPSGPMTVAPVEPGERLAIRRGEDGWVLSGVATRVPSASIAGHLVALAEDPEGAWHVALVEASRCAVAADTNLAAERRDEVRFDDVALDPTAVAPVSVDPDQLLRRASFGRAVLTLGALEAVLDLTLRYAGERRQFGRPLSGFQVVQAMLAVLAREVALARAATDLAADAIVADDELPLLEATAAAVVCGDSATRVAASAHQLHGAIGVTREHQLHLFTRRLWAWRDDGTPAADWSRRLGAALLDGEGDLWSEVAPTAAQARQGDFDG